MEGEGVSCCNDLVEIYRNICGDPGECNYLMHIECAEGVKQQDRAIKRMV